MSFASQILNWWKKQSNQNAANPKPSPAPSNPQPATGTPQPLTPIETNIDEDLVLGLNFGLGCRDSVAQGVEGELIRSRMNLRVLCGCSHIASQIEPVQEEGKAPTVGIAGKCRYCEQEYMEMVLNGEIPPAEADRRSLVCTNCARMTVSGILACPRHSTPVDDGAGNTVYLGPEEVAAQNRKRFFSRLAAPVIGLFIEDVEPDSPEAPDEK